MTPEPVYDFVALLVPLAIMLLVSLPVALIFRYWWKDNEDVE